MAIEWSGLSPELLIRLDRSAREPLRTQLETSLREAIRGGRLRAGERLPSSRELARELGVSRGMVQECYGQLLAEGYLTDGFLAPLGLSPAELFRQSDLSRESSVKGAKYFTVN